MPNDTTPTALLTTQPEIIFATDRYGTPSGPNNAYLADKIDKAGLTEAAIEEIVKPIAHCFEDETAFLVIRTDSDGPVEDRLALWIEFEISDEFLPAKEPRPGMPVAEIDQWRQAISLFAPHMARVAKGLASDPETFGPDARCVFDFSAFYNGAICIQLSLEAARTAYRKAYDLLYRSDGQFPPSMHMQLAAMGDLDLELDASLPDRMVPGRAAA